MKVTLQGRRIEVSEAYREHVETALAAIFEKYFGEPLDVSVTLVREGDLFRVVIATHVGRGIEARAGEEAEDAYKAFDRAAEHLAKRLRRYKRRLRDHRRDQGGGAQGKAAQHYVIAGEAEEESLEDGPDNPVVVAETPTRVETMTASQAVMRLDLGDEPALLFRSAAHGGLNMVYRRHDGNIGWVDAGPSENG